MRNFGWATVLGMGLLIGVSGCRNDRVSPLEALRSESRQALVTQCEMAESAWSAGVWPEEGVNQRKRALLEFDLTEPGLTPERCLELRAEIQRLLEKECRDAEIRFRTGNLELIGLREVECKLLCFDLAAPGLAPEEAGQLRRRIEQNLAEQHRWMEEAYQAGCMDLATVLERRIAWQHFRFSDAVLTPEQRNELRRELGESRKRLVELRRSQYEAGAGSQADVLNAELALVRFRLEDPELSEDECRELLARSEELLRFLEQEQ